MPNDRQATTYNQIVGVLKTGELYILEDIFKYTSGFHGATRYEMRKLTKDQIEYQNDLDYIKETYKDLWQEQVANDGTEQGLDEWAEELIANTEADPERYSPTDDPSFRRETDQAYEKLTDEQKKQLDKVFGKKGVDFVDYDCGSCGRCSKLRPEDFELLLNPELLTLINEAEEQ